MLHFCTLCTLRAGNHKPSDFMHMSSACPGGRPPGLPGGHVGEYKGMEWVLGQGEIQEIVSESMNWCGGIRNIVESWSATTAISLEYLRPTRREKTQPGHLKKLSEINLADTSRNHKTWLWLALIYNWRVHSMKSRNFVIFVLHSVFHCTESRARIFKQGAWQVSDLTIRHPWFRLSPWVGKWCLLLLLLHCLPASFVSHWRRLVVCQLKGARSNVSIYKLLLFSWKLSSLSWTWTQRTESPKSSSAQNCCFQVQWRIWQGFLARNIWPADFVSQNERTPEGNCQLCSMHFTIPLVGPGVDPWGKPITYALVHDHCKICFITVVWCTDNSGWHTCLSLHVTGILWNLHCMRWCDKCTGVISCLWISRLSMYYMMFWKQYCVVSVIGAI